MSFYFLSSIFQRTKNFVYEVQLITLWFVFFVYCLRNLCLTLDHKYVHFRSITILGLIIMNKIHLSLFLYMVRIMDSILFVLHVFQHCLFKRLWCLYLIAFTPLWKIVVFYPWVYSELYFVPFVYLSKFNKNLNRNLLAFLLRLKNSSFGGELTFWQYWYF